MEVENTMVTPVPWPEGWVIFWPVVVALLEAATVPALAILGVIVARPILKTLLSSGGSIEAFGAKVSVAQQVERETRALSVEVDNNIREEAAENPDAAPETAVVVGPSSSNPSEAMRDGWSQIDRAAREALRELKAPAYVVGYMSQNPILAINWLALEKWIGLPLRDTIKSLIELRTKAEEAMRNGQSILTADAAREFNVTAQKAGRALTNAVAYRLRKNADSPPSSSPGSTMK